MPKDYVTDPETPWRYVSDQVMGGVSEGAADIVGGALRLTGSVSTANRGGFIQVRSELLTRLAPSRRGLELSVKGNGERYFLHVRTTGTRLPWQYYQAGFETGSTWQNAQIPFTQFRASGRLLRARPRPEDITSIGLVAFGRDHEALVLIKNLRSYA